MNIPNTSRPSSGAKLAFGTAIACVLLIHIWAAHGTNHGNFASSTRGEMYGQLADAFLAGQTHLKFEPDPALKNLADPYLDSPWLPRLHDATYFRGRYYLYFGPGAALALFAPWQLLTGTYLSDGGGTAILVAVGFLLGSILLWKMWSRWFASSLPAGWLAGAVLLWGLGNYSFLLIDGATFYSVPIVFAYTVCVGALVAIWLAVVSPRWRGTVGWFAAASLLWAATLSGRPNYLFSLPVLAIPFLHLRSAAIAKFGRRSTWPLFLAGALPVAVVGITLAAYNWVRYGKLTEFGVHYQFAMGDQRETKLFEWGHFWTNFKSYLFSFPDLSPYFPFTSNLEQGYSLFFCAPVVAIALLFPTSLGVGRFRNDPVWRTLGLTFVAAFLLNFISLLGVPWANERYFGDFTPLLILVAIVTMGFLVDAATTRTRAARISLRIALGALAGWTFVFVSIFIVARYPDRAAIAPVTKFAIGLAYRVEQLRDIGHGPLHLQVIFGPAAPGTVEPLVVSGHGRDLLFVKHLENDRVQFGFFHAGNPAVFGEPVEIKRQQPAVLDINLGALYPPPEHPLMTGWSAAQIEMLNRTVTVHLNQKEVLHTYSVFYPTHPDDVRIGSNPQGLLATKKFSGTLTSIAPRVMPTPADLAKKREDGPVRLTLTLPPFTVFRSEPLVSTGRRGSGDVVFVSYIKKDHIRFGHDSSGFGAVLSETVFYDPTLPHVIEIDMGSLRSSTASKAGDAPLIIRFDDRALLDEQRPFNPSTPDQVVFGFDGMGSGIVAEAFGGHISEVKTVERLPITRLMAHAQGHGAVRLTLKFPEGAAGRSEPLLVTGVTGAGDVFYVTYLDENRIKLGVDHWGVGACLSEPITVDPEKDHTIDVSIASLFPDDRDPWWSSTPPSERRRRLTRVIVQLDGTTVLDQPQLAHPSKPEQVTAGTNLIGASTCGPTFRGKIFTASRLPPP